MAILYEKYKKEKQAKEEKKDISEQFGVDAEKIVVKKVSTFSRVIEIIEEIVFKILKIIFYAIICILSSIGATVLINSSLRDVFIELVKNTFL